MTASTPPSAVVDRDGAFDVPGRFVKAALRAVLVVRLGVGFPRLWSCGSTRGLGQMGHVVLDLVIIGLAITVNPLALVPSILILGSQKVRD